VRTVWVDCDVIQADGGTRTASITGAFVATVLAVGKVLENRAIKKMPVTDHLCATAEGVLAIGQEILDVNYEEDSQALVDMNVVMTGSGEFVEIQGTGEEATFSNKQLQTMLQLAEEGLKQIIEKQKDVLGELAGRIGETKANASKEESK